MLLVPVQETQLINKVRTGFLLSVRKCSTHGVCWWYASACRMPCTMSTHIILWLLNFLISNRLHARNAQVEHALVTWTAPMQFIVRMVWGRGGGEISICCTQCFTYFTLTYPSVLFTSLLQPDAHSMPIEKNVHEHFHSIGSERGLQPWYFLLATCVPRIGFPIFRPQTACMYP